jgi:regulator of sigma E protease
MYLTLVIAFFTLIALIIIHELGHFVAAKKLGVKVEEFGLGYPPRIWGKKVGETLYSLNALPFGGFVKIYGQEEEIKDSKSFSEKPFWKKSIIILGGVFSFWIISAIILTFVMLIGAPTIVEDNNQGNLINPKVQIVSVAPNSPAALAGLQAGDTIKNVDKVSEVQEMTKENLGKEITLIIQRGDKVFEVKLVPRASSPKGEGSMGVGLARTALVKYPWYLAPIKGIGATLNLTWAIIQSWIYVFSSLFKGGGLPPGVEVTGVVGIFQLFTQVGSLGVSYFLQFIAVIAIYLALANSLPIPALDGGWFMFLVIEKIRKKPLNQLTIQKVSAVFFFALIALMIWVTVKDIIRIF